jgi:kynureninase
MSDLFTLAHARLQDQKDELNHFRSRFELNDENLIYLDGNSLGALPSKTIPHLDEVSRKEWGEGLILSWGTDWYDRPSDVGGKLAQLIGAQPDEVIVTDSTSVNLFKLAYAALKFQSGKTRIVSDELNFPSDLYIFQGLIEMFGNKHQLKLVGSEDGMSVSMQALSKIVDTDTALLSLSHVLFKSSFMYDMQAVNKLAHENGALVLWDLSHAVGAVPIHLNDSQADLAVGCTYKYLNGGPGSTAFLYVRKDLQDKLQSPVWGWFGQNNPFDFSLQYEAAPGIRRFMAGSPPLLSLSTLEPALDILLEAGMERIRAKSIQQTDYFLQLAKKFLLPLGFSIGSPANATERGSHISLKHPEAFRICQSLISPIGGDKTIIPDFRKPDNIRLGIAPLYNTFTEIYEAVMQLKKIVEQRYYLQFSNKMENIS